MPKKLPVVGVFALAGAGKTLASRYLAEFTGWKAISADDLTHQVLKQKETKLLLQAYFGSRILFPSNEINRIALSEVVFRNTSSRALLERCVWPGIESLLLDEISKNQDGAIIDAAVLVRARWHNYCDRLVYIESKEQLRTQRLLKERGKTEEQARFMFQAQADILKSRVKADYIVKNNGTVDNLKRKMEKIAKELLFIFPARSTLKMEA